MKEGKVEEDGDGQGKRDADFERAEREGHAPASLLGQSPLAHFNLVLQKSRMGENSTSTRTRRRERMKERKEVGMRGDRRGVQAV